ncbi:MAG: zinc metalloprotease [Alphaproteobacteria bacterium]|nr:MAG: zinc metalloprotease [Alphaproteobacteria bacterium]
MEFIGGLPHYLISFLIVLSVLVFVHELGHFWVARRCGVRVEVFSIGFGPELFGFNDRHGTRWKFSALPLGGYVKMFGHTETVPDGEGGERPILPEERGEAFHYKRLSQRAAIVFAGPLANFLFAIVVLAALFAIHGQTLSSTVIGEVVPGSAAEAAGLQPGDRILSLNGREIDSFEEVAQVVQFRLDQPLEVVVERDGAALALNALPDAVETTDAFGNTHRVGRLGITSSGPGEMVRYGPVSALGMAVQETYRITVSTLEAVWQMVIGVRPSEEIGGVLRIAKMSGDVAQVGFASTVFFAAVLSINLGLINLFPVPMLDGGHLAFYALEALRGRPLDARTQEWGFRIGLVLVLALFVFATHNDLMSFPAVAQFIERLIT